MAERHRVFVSYHHENDQSRKNIFELRFGNAADVIVPGGVGLGDIDPGLPTETIRQKIRDEYLRDTSVTVVLVGTDTWRRKHVDWEIASSIRATKLNPRSGLLGLLLPSYQALHEPGKYDPHTIPPRLHDNIECGYALLRNWTEDAEKIRAWVHEAYLLKSRVEPDNSYATFVNNKSGDRWW